MKTDGLSTIALTAHRSSPRSSVRLFASTIQKEDSAASGISISREDEGVDGVPSLPKAILKRNKRSKIFRDGSQLVFSKSIEKLPNKSLKLGDLVQVEVPGDTGKGGKTDDIIDKNKQNVPPLVVGWGVYNPESMYRIRILCHTLLHPEMKQHIAQAATLSDADSDFQEQVLERILGMNFQRSLQTRHALGLPSSSTDTFRLVNGEGDSVSGLAVDVIGDKVAVIMSSAAWCQVHQDTILKSLQNVLPNHELIWKTTPSRLKQDGFQQLDNTEDDDNENVASEALICIENGIKYETFPHHKGQKTSVYCDQRENRWNMAQLCDGKDVLDLCCYHGGFALNAAKHGAKRVVGVDSSSDAIETCVANLALNEFDEEISVDFVKSDISDFMKACQDKYQVVVLDPPKLAPSVSSLPKASRKYHSLNRDAIKLIDDDGGLLLTCTCSAAMTQDGGGRRFLEMVQQASLAARREVTLLRVSGAAPCHTQSPFSFPAGNYLTAALFMVHAKSE